MTNDNQPVGRRVAPERIWIDSDGRDRSFWNDTGDAIGTTEYVRADLLRKGPPAVIPNDIPERLYIRSRYASDVMGGVYHLERNERDMIEYIRAALVHQPPVVSEQQLTESRTLSTNCINCGETILVVHAVSHLERCYEGYQNHEEAKDTFASLLQQAVVSERCGEYVERLKALRRSSLWNADGYDGALSALIQELERK